MQRIALMTASALGIAFAQAAVAADLPVAPVAPLAPIVVGYNWSGYYLGANLGWSNARSNISWSPNSAGFVDASAIASASNNRLTSNSATGGIQTGYNWQWGNVVAGLEADISFMSNNVNLSVAPLPPPAFGTTSLSEIGQAQLAGDRAPPARIRVGQLAALRHRRLGPRQGRVR